MTTQDHKERDIKESKQPASSTREPLILHGFTCPITQELMQSPVVTADGMSYEETAIKLWFAQGKKTSPLTGLALSHQLLTPNVNLRQAIADFLTHEPEFAKIKELERVSKTQEQLMLDLQLAIRLREEELETQRTKQEKHDEKPSPARLLSQQGLLSEDPHSVEQRLGKAVLALIDALSQHLPTIEGHHFDPNAPAGFASALVNALRKQKNDSQALSRLLESPADQAVPTPVAHFLSSYLAQHPTLHKLTEHTTFAKSLEINLSKMSITALRAQYGQEAAAGTASSHASSSSSSSSSAGSSAETPVYTAYS